MDPKFKVLGPVPHISSLFDLSMVSTPLQIRASFASCNEDFCDYKIEGEPMDRVKKIFDIEYQVSIE